MGQQRVHEDVRLLVTPGMEHCGGASGPNQFGDVPDGKGDPDTNLATALQRWVEQGIAPERIVATKRRDDENPNSEVLRSRPLCAWPLVRTIGARAAPTSHRALTAARSRSLPSANERLGWRRRVESGQPSASRLTVSPRPAQRPPAVDNSCTGKVHATFLPRRTSRGGRGVTLVALGYLLPALGYLLPALGYLLAGCPGAWSRASPDGTQNGSSRHRLCRPSSAPGNPGGCPAYHHGDRPRRSAHTWLL
jgi:hypothetical protein